jgi:branched-chain amino acid transport system substrate-binding protein
MAATRSGQRRRVTKLCAAAGLLAMTAACGSSAPSSSGSTITVGLIVDVTGIEGAYNGPNLPVMEAVLNAANASGGIHGVKFNIKTYDSQSTPAGGLTAVRQAISDHDFAILAEGGGFDSGLALLASAGIPTIGSGDSPNWTGPDRAALFPWQGDDISENTTAWMKYCVSLGKTKFALITGSNPASIPALEVWKKMVPLAGGTVVLFREGINSANTVDLTATAHEVINSGANCVLNLLDYPVALQPELNQLGGSDIVDVQATSFGSAVTSQYGNSANGVVYANFPASPYATQDPGVRQYLAFMHKYVPSQDPAGLWEKGYVAAEFFLHALSELKPPFTQQNLIKVLNSTNGYTADGMSGPISFPDFHLNGDLCLSYSVVRNGTWQAAINSPDPFVCGSRYGTPETSSSR